MYQPFFYKLKAPLDNKFALISLLCYITNQMRAKDKNWKVLKSIKLIRNDKFSQNSPEFIEGLSSLCEDLMFGQTEFPTFELNSYREMFNVINSVMDQELPFINKGDEDCPF